MDEQTREKLREGRWAVIWAGVLTVAIPLVGLVLAPLLRLTLGLTIFASLMVLLGCLFAVQGAKLLAVSRDLARRHEQGERQLQAMSRDLRSQQAELAQANARLTEVSRAKSDVLASMSHELRTPLNAVIGFSEVLEDQICGPLNDKQREYVRDILTSGSHLLDLINDILDLARVEAGKEELDLARIPLRDCLNASLNLLKEKAMRRDLQLSLEVEPAADIEIEADPRKLRQILYNLLSNAVKFTPEGGSVRLHARRVAGQEPEL